MIAGGETLFDYRDYRAAFERSCAAELGVAPVVLGPVGRTTSCRRWSPRPTCSRSRRLKEGFGLAAMEALAAGRPVVTRDLPVLREVFGDTVSYASTPDGFAAALCAGLESSDDPGPGRALAGSLMWERSARRHVEFYEANPHAALTDHGQRKLPQPFGIGGVERIRRHATGAGTAAAIDASGLVAVLEVATADAVEQWRGGQQCRRRGALLDGLEVRAARLERLQRVLGILPRAGGVAAGC